MLEEKVGKFIDEVVEMLKPLKRKTINRASEISAHIAAWWLYWNGVFAYELKSWDEFKKMYRLAFEHCIIREYWLYNGIRDEIKEEMVKRFCKIYSPDEFEKVFNEIKDGISRTIKIAEGVK
jgi:hypothetical protein